MLRREAACSGVRRRVLVRITLCSASSLTEISHEELLVLQVVFDCAAYSTYGGGESMFHACTFTILELQKPRLL